VPDLAVRGKGRALFPMPARASHSRPIMLRYNIPKWGGPGPQPATGPAAPIDADRPSVSRRQDRRAGFGVISVALHAAAIAALALVLTRPTQPPPPDELRVEMVFEQPAPPPEPVAEAPPEPPPPVAELPPEQPPPVAETPPPERPQPPKPRPPRPKPPLPRPTAQLSAEPPPTTSAPTMTPVAPVVDRNWQSAVSAWIAARKTYPEEARRRGEEGNVLVRLTVDRSGQVLEATVFRASGSVLLDEATLRLLGKAVLPAFPADMTLPRITIMTTMHYSLQ
jgi:protein TonB